MYKIEYMPLAIKDFLEIEEYLNAFSQTAADKFTEALKKQTDILTEHPFIYPVYERDSFFRRMVLGDYLLFYSVDDKRKLAIMHRIFHHSRNQAI